MRGALVMLGGVAAVGASVVAGIAMGNYTTAGASSFYVENYRAMAARQVAADGATAEAFWDAQGVPRALAPALPAGSLQLPPIPDARYDADASYQPAAYRP